MTELGPVNIQLTASGISEVLNAFKSVEDRCVALERKLEQIGQAGARKRVKIAKDEAAEKGKSSEKEGKDHDKAEQDKTKASEKWAKQRERIVHNSAMMAGRLAKQQADEEIREAQRSANSRMAFSRQLAGRIVSDFRSTLGHVTRIFGALTALGGGISVAGAYSREMAISRESQNAALVTHVPGKPKEAVPAAVLEAQARQTAKQFNVHPEDVLSSQKELMSKSSMGTSVLGLTPDLIKIAKAENTGQDPKEFQDKIFQATGIMIKQGMAPEHAMSMIRTMVGQGRSAGGTTEFSEMAGALPRLTSKAALFEGNQEGNMLKMTSLFQSGFKATGSIGEATTAVERFSDDLLKRDKSGRSKVEKFLGHSVTRGGKIIGPEQILPEIFNKSGGDIGKLENAGLNVRSNRLLLGYLKTFQDAEKDKSGSGGKAVHDEIMKTATASLSKEEVDKDYTERQKSRAEKSEEVWNKFDEVIREKLTPVITDKLIPALEKCIPTFEKLLESVASFISWAADHPWLAAFAGAGAILGKAVIMEVAASGLKGILASLGKFVVGGGAPGVGGGLGGAVGGPGTLGAVAAGLTIGVGTGLAVVSNTESIADRDKAALIKKQEMANDLLNKISNPNAKEEDIAQARATLAALDKKIDEQESFFGRTGAAVKKGAGFLKGEKGSEASDMLNFVPLFAGYQGLMGGSSFGGAEQQAKLAEVQRDQLKRALEAHDKNTTSTTSNTTALNNLTTKLDNLPAFGGFGGSEPPRRDQAGNIISDHKPGGASSKY